MYRKSVVTKLFCKNLTAYFSLEVKNKPNEGTAFPVFILGAGMITNSYCISHVRYNNSSPGYPTKVENLKATTITACFKLLCQLQQHIFQLQ
jgi:hypothetical protein